MLRSIMVLEGPWDGEDVGSESLWPFIQQFAQAAELAAFHRTFFDTASFRHWLGTFHKNNDAPQSRLLYVAAHGSPGKIEGLAGGIQRRTVFAALRKAKSLRYVHFGCCDFGQPANLVEALQKSKHLQWAAGYCREVDWVDATVFDILFWNRLLRDEDDEETQRVHFYSLMRTFLVRDVNGLADKLGFVVAYRRGDAIEVLAPPYQVES
jgi:hypothetical protein